MSKKVHKAKKKNKKHTTKKHAGKTAKKKGRGVGRVGENSVKK